jgi:hypothetical protein
VMLLLKPSMRANNTEVHFANAAADVGIYKWRGAVVSIMS